MRPSELNAAASPMHLFEDGEILSKEEYERRKEAVLVKQETKSPFLVGTIAQVSAKIGELDRCLQDYTQLVFDSRLSDQDDEMEPKMAGFPPGSSLVNARYRRKARSPVLTEKEQAEISKFGGVYAIHSGRREGDEAVQMQPDRIKNVHKISMKAKKKERKKSADSGVKPKFVELFTFPGYQTKSLTALPHDVACSDVFDKVCKAQEKHGKRKLIQYEDESRRMLYCLNSQALLQDIYWWVFLDKFSSQKSNQPHFFNRISHNYVRLIQLINSYQYRDRLLDYYSDTMAQSVYVAFSETFPDSYKQFDDEFKEYLLQVITEWMTGILPAPRKFLKWSPELEPAGKKREQAMGKTPAAAKTETVNSADDWIAQIDAMSDQNRSLRRVGSEVSLTSRMSRNSQNAAFKGRHNRGTGSESSRSDESKRIMQGDSGRSKFPRPPASLALSKALTPVQERRPGGLSVITDGGLEEETGTIVTRDGSPSKSIRKRIQTTKQKPGRESHPACKGADMVKSLFDVRGSCPLISHFLRSHDLEHDAGMKLTMSRSELKNLPPLNAPTYSQIIKETFKTIKNIEKGIHKHIKDAEQKHSTFVIQQNKETKLYRGKQELLLNDGKEVKRLSNLLIIDHASQKEKGEKASDKKSKTDQLFEEALLKVDAQVRQS